ncbi:hypothetical protein OIT44_02640 [Weissella ceti]|uniref:Transcriptional regulator n=1 Tax=Weissella ceti TaxID=759620 RepID=A0ABT3E3I3_9LACO|nr:hypothetical protein [Weissella ceti]MCW0952969.1 hypothetical protein [Weissella ceti]
MKIDEILEQELKNPEFINHYLAEKERSSSDIASVLDRVREH